MGSPEMVPIGHSNMALSPMPSFSQAPVPFSPLLPTPQDTLLRENMSPVVPMFEPMSALGPASVHPLGEGYPGFRTRRPVFKRSVEFNVNLCFRYVVLSILRKRPF